VFKRRLITSLITRREASHNERIRSLKQMNDYKEETKESENRPVRIGKEIKSPYFQTALEGGFSGFQQSIHRYISYYLAVLA
jgi:hypothetical protein